VKLTQTEPVVAGITPALVASVVLGGLQVFDIWTPTQDQNQWIYTALLPLLMAVGAWFGRRHAWAPASVNAALEAEQIVANQKIAVATDKAQADAAQDTLRLVTALTTPPPPPPPPPSGRVNPPQPPKPPALSELPPQGGPEADRRTTREQLDQIGFLYGRLGRPWHVADPAAMMEAISYQEAASLIVELQGKPLEQQLDRGATARGAAQ
jgi:hypothetical protein